MKFCVIGLGRFGFAVATKLAENGAEVLAVDSIESNVAAIRDKVTHAITMRVNDEDDLKSIGAEDFDTVIVAMGENFAQSILVTAILKQRLKVPKVITRSISAIHRDILQIIGADQVILPEQEVGRKLADTLSLPFASIIQLAKNFGISQLKAPRSFIGKTIKELGIEPDYDVKCIAKKIDKEFNPLKEDDVIDENDILVFSGNNRSLENISRL